MARGSGGVGASGEGECEQHVVAQRAAPTKERQVIVERAVSRAVIAKQSSAGGAEDDECGAGGAAACEALIERERREDHVPDCLLYTSPSPRDLSTPRMPSSA